MALVVENPPANAGDLRDAGSIPGWERSPGGGHGNPSSILAWRITWTEEPGRLHSPWSCRRVTERLSIHTHTHTHTHTRNKTGSALEKKLGVQWRDGQQIVTIQGNMCCNSDVLVH